MYLKKLIISGKKGLIREIKFELGVNLIIDSTEASDIKKTGNNIGKTTVLKLIDFCLGANGKYIYTDIENSNSEYLVVKRFLIDEEVLIKLVLADDILDEESRTVVIERNFLSRNKSIRRINGVPVLEKEYEKRLWETIFQTEAVEKPSFRQVISHSIRYKNESIDNTLKTLGPFGKAVEYEALYLYLLGCNVDLSERKQKLNIKLKQEQAFHEKLEDGHKKTDCEIALELVLSEIDSLETSKNRLGLKASTENDVEELNSIKREINKSSSIISKLNIRKTLINEAKQALSNEKAELNIIQLRSLYAEAKTNIVNLERTFEELVEYHNKMVVERLNYIIKDLPVLDNQINREKEHLSVLLEQEKKLSEKVSRSDAFSDLKEIISNLNENYRQKGEYETIISQLNESERRINLIKDDLAVIDEKMLSNDYKNNLKKQLVSFNMIYGSISQELYGEKYMLSYEETEDQSGTKIYKFISSNSNIGSGKKQGEILCFDLAYVLYAQANSIPCLHFILNDKKELMADNQLIKTAEFVQNKPIQIVVSMLKDKVPERALLSSNIALELSQDDKLFRIEKN